MFSLIGHPAGGQPRRQARSLLARRKRQLVVCRSIADGAIGPPSLIQSSYNADTNGNFEIGFEQGNELVHYTKIQSINQWKRSGLLPTDTVWVPNSRELKYATGPICLIQGRIRDGKHGNFELVVREGEEGAELGALLEGQFSAGGAWRRGGVVTAKATGPGSIVHGLWGLPGILR